MTYPDIVSRKVRIELLGIPNLGQFDKVFSWTASPSSL